MFKRAWLAGLAGVFAISAGVSAAKAESYTLTVVEASCGGSSATCTPENFPAEVKGFTGTWNSTLAAGGLNFNLQTGGMDTIGGFLATGTGNLTNFVSVNGGALTDLLSAGNFVESTLFIFEGTVVGPNSGNIAHDDGISLRLNGTLIAGGLGSPTVPKYSRHIRSGSVTSAAHLGAGLCRGE